MNELIIEKVTLNVTINGTDYPFVADGEFARKISGLAKEASRRASICAITGCDDFTEASAFLSHAVDTLIGEGSSFRIFGTDYPDPVDICDVLGRISDVFFAYRRERIAKLRGDYL